MKTEFKSLSDEEIAIAGFITEKGLGHPTMAYESKDVKEAVKRLKRKMEEHMKYCIGKEDMRDVINQIFGDKLTK